MPKDAVNFAEVAFFLRRLPNRQEIAEGLEHCAKLEEFIASLNADIDGLEAKRTKLDADIAALEKEKAAKLNEVGVLLPEAHARQRTIIQDAEGKAAKIISDAATSAAKMKADADAHQARVIARVSKIREELS